MNMNIADEASMARPVYICGVLIMIEPVRLHTYLHRILSLSLIIGCFA